MKYLQQKHDTKKIKTDTTILKELKRIYNYNKDTGLFTWRIKPCTWVNVGDVAGNQKHRSGYIYLYVNKKTYSAHRLAFLYVTGEIPKQVDHIDHNRKNNKWSNLAPANSTINNKNASLRKDNTSGHVGVEYRSDNNKWRVLINLNGKRITVGHFHSKLAAIEARKNAEKEFGYHKNHGAQPCS